MDIKPTLMAKSHCLAALCLTIVLGACGGGGGGSSPDQPGAGGGNTTTVRMGNLSGSAFANGALEISDTGLVAGGSASVSVDFVDPSGSLITDTDFAVTFSSTCVTAGTATFDQAQITSNEGVATAIYNVGAGCNESDTLLATATISGTRLTATGTVTMTPVRMGSLIGTSFTEDLVEMSVSSLVAGSSAEVRIDFVDSDNVKISTQDFQVTFSSTCSDNAQGSFAAATVTSAGGTASTVYTPGFACSGTDVITARATVDGDDFVATTNLTIGVPDFSSDTIEYVSASPDQIFLSGSGGVERSTVTFLVKNDDGLEAEGRTVDFTLDSVSGGASLINSSNVSGADGLVTVVVRAGNSPTPLVVRAAIRDTTASTQSRELTVGTGVADYNHFSLAASVHNVDAYNWDGDTSSLTARLADRYGNPVPDGTPITFTTEGGSIETRCTTTDGKCSVTWTGQEPRPTGTIDKGIAEVLAVANGNESFTDLDGDGLFDNGESFVDLTEPYRDDNFNGSHDSVEYFVDSNLNGLWDGADTKFTGTSCAPGATNCTGTVRSISKYQRIVMSDGGNSPDIPNFSNVPSPINTGFSTVLTVWDNNHNALPIGTIITVTASSGTILFPTGAVTVESTLFPTQLAVIYSVGTATADGLFSISIKMPHSTAVAFTRLIDLP
jgi:hypothetical protein